MSRRRKQNTKQLTATAKQQQIIVNQIEVRPVNRQILDIGKWRTALQAADMGRRTQLLNMYEDVIDDPVLGDAIDKRIRAVTGADLTFQYQDGEESEEMIDLIDTEDFEYLLQEVTKAKFWYMSVIQPSFDETGMHVYSVPRKHIRPETKMIAKMENDPEGQISYADMDVIEVISREHKHGLILRACPYAIFKRGGFGDWAQMVELFGMPLRIGKYSIYDVEARKALQDAFNNQGAAATLIVPKETDVETTTQSGNGGGTLYKDFIETCDEQLLITILSQTMTTKDGASRSQGQVHKEVEEEVNKSDLRFVQRVLNHKLKPILERRGYNVSGGSFVFPKAIQGLTVDELISLSDVIEIPAYYFQEKFGIPAAEKDDVIAKRSTQATKSEPDDDPDLDEPGSPKSKKLFDRFFAVAPTKERGTQTSFARRLIDGITGRVTLKDNESDSYSIDLGKLLNEALKEVYGGNDEVVNKKLFKITDDALQQGIDKVFSEEPEFGKKKQDFVDEFKTNTSVFAAFKNHQQTKEIAALLHDEEGNLRSFREFKKQALQISKDYNVNWLQTEYNTAIRSARAAVNYKKYLETEHLYPNLEYLISTAKNKRETHLEYVGTILPIQHPWWDTHMPPSDWNCACRVQPTDKDVTPVPGGEFVPPEFQNNPGKTAEFVKISNTPYFSETADEIRDEVIEFAKQYRRRQKDREIKEWTKKHIPQFGIQLQKENFKTGQVLVTKRAIKSITGHFTELHMKELAKDIFQIIDRAQFLSEAALNIESPNYASKKRRGVEKYYYYKLYFKGVNLRLNTEVINGVEQPYAINIIIKK
ncbi:MAG TPA: hypothetical protein DEG28_01040 [Porphyromonadaceae bacterium]|nr:hypothetical protein [Porphyromonadaceae bacterium]